MKSILHIGILAGEASGDILGAGLMRAIQNRHPQVRFTGIGGPLMEAAGLDSRVPMERLSVMGLIDPLKRLPELLSIRKSLFNALKNDPPAVFIGIDSPDFNLGLEKQLKAAGIATVHYVSPSVWAWRQGRIHKIKKAVSLMLTLFPFEEAFYQEHGVPVKCIGHPLADEFSLDTDTAAARTALDLPDSGKVLAILPGSRAGEVSRLAPVFLETARLCTAQFPALKLVIPCAGPDREQQIRDILQGDDLDVTLIQGQSRTVMAAADCVLMASGTAALEGMLLKKPMVVSYKMAPLSYAIISRLLKSPYVSLPNLLAGRQLVPELLQTAAEPVGLSREVLQFLSGDNRQEVVDTWYRIHESLRRGASGSAADAVLELCGG